MIRWWVKRRIRRQYDAWCAENRGILTDPTILYIHHSWSRWGKLLDVKVFRKGGSDESVVSGSTD